ncbi:hypothetical protein MPH47_19520 [Psychrobacillus psychrodurans]|uniref:hypothetical protein n=1 Tax=Psychrobacillus psychrodurans TaxID=126157 RepID=UPI001F4D61E7|nr:hypothetical protein [Psychrobacillus psychrodurans]MCK1999387.1 hypothetical protein [Psychrobacillus psychrodurans]
MEWEEWEDEYGVYKSRTNELGIIETLTEYKQKYWDENPPKEPELQPPTEIELLQQENLVLQLALAETIEKQETDKINNQIALAELVEKLTLQGVL